VGLTKCHDDKGNGKQENQENQVSEEQLSKDVVGGTSPGRYLTYAIETQVSEEFGEYGTV